MLDAHTWIQVVDGFERAGAASVSYTDPRGRSQATGGKNLAPRAFPGNLDTTATGSSGHSSYHWAGLSYWANTQAIRFDVKDGASMDKVRVKTFMIDVDESSLSDEAAKSTSYYLAGKYGYFDDVAENGNPFTEPDGAQWLDGAFPKGYVKASQPSRLIAGVQRFFDEASQGGSALSAAALSSNSLAARSPDSRRYNSSFTAGNWMGTVRATTLRLHTPTNTITEDPAALWDANQLLTTASNPAATVTAAHVRPAERKIFTYVRSATPKAVAFTFAATNNGADLPASFNKVPYTQDTDNLAQARIDYLRGERSGEASGLFRARRGIMGDILNSGTVYKAGANPNLQGPDYTTFFNNQKNRTPVIYVGANDGMLHAFKADNGKELFAYIPGAVLEKLPQLTSKNYIHTPFVDAVAAVEEIQLAGGWRTALVSGMGGGAQGVFALDVTNPENFGTGNVMFEFTDQDDPQMGNVVGRPSLVKMRTGSTAESFKYFAVVASGYNNYKADGRAALNNDQVLFFLDLGKSTGVAWSEGVNYFKVALPAANATALNGLAQPGIRYGLQGEAIEFFAGDLQGQLWKAAFADGISRAGAEAAVRKKTGVKTPMFMARDANSLPQPITAPPVIYPYLPGGNMVIFGTGKYMESADRTASSPQSIYGVWDSGRTVAENYELVRGKLNPVVFHQASRQFQGTAVTFSLAADGKRGWYADLPFGMERIVNAGTESTGVVSFSSTIPPPSVCSDNGRSEDHFFRPSSGFSAAPSLSFNGGLLNQSAVLEIELVGEPAYGKRASSGRRTAVKKDVHSAQGATANGSATVDQGFRVNYLATGRVYWREVRDFNQVGK